MLDFGGREVGLVVEEIVGLDGGFAGRVKGDGDGEEGGGGIVVVVSSARVRGGWGLSIGAGGKEESESGGQECAED